MVLNILVIHGYVQSAQTLAYNTQPLKAALSDIAVLHYVDGPPMRDFSGHGSRPWWFLGGRMVQSPENRQRWDDVVCWWSGELSGNQYDGIIGLSQGAAMAALLVSMLNTSDAIPGFNLTTMQPLRFAIMSSGFVSTSFGPHQGLYSVPVDLPTLHTVDYEDAIVQPQETVALQQLFPRSILREHHEGHAVPVRGDWPQTMRSFIVESVGA